MACSASAQSPGTGGLIPRTSAPSDTPHPAVVRIRQSIGYGQSSEGSATLIDKFTWHSLWLTAAHVVSRGLNSRVEIDPPNHHGQDRYSGYVVKYDPYVDAALVFASHKKVYDSIKPMQMWAGGSRLSSVIGEGFPSRGFQRIYGTPVASYRLSAIPGHSGGPIYVSIGGQAQLVGVISSSNWGDTWPPTRSSGPSGRTIRNFVHGSKWKAGQHLFTSRIQDDGYVRMCCDSVQGCPPMTFPAPQGMMPPPGIGGTPYQDPSVPPQADFGDPMDPKHDRQFDDEQGFQYSQPSEPPQPPPAAGADEELKAEVSESLSEINKSLAAIQGAMVNEDRARQIAKEEASSVRNELEQIVIDMIAKSDPLLRMSERVDAIASQSDSMKQSAKQIGQSISRMESTIAEIIKDVEKLSAAFDSFKGGTFEPVK